MKCCCYYSKITLFFLSFWLWNNILAQGIKQFEKSNLSVSEPCLFDFILAKRRQDSLFRKMEVEHNLKMAQKTKQPILKTICQIPVVVHVFHLGESIGSGTNISDSQIQSAIDNLNNVWRNTANNSNTVDLGVEFHLAVRDPDCNSTTGIVRVNASSVSGYSQYGVNYSLTSGADEQTLKDLSKWPTDQYMNIWIVSEIDDNNGNCGTTGYANLPVGIDQYNGIIMMAGQFGYDPDGTLGYVFGQCGGDNSTLIHEVGHFFDLYHTFEGGGTGICPSSETDCLTENDMVCDTPPHMNYLDNTTLYFNCPTGHLNECSSGNMDQVIHNHMNYTGCPDRFTLGQKARVQACVNSSRMSLTTSLGLTPPNGVYTQPLASCSSNTTGLGLNGAYAGITQVNFNNLNVVSANTSSDNPVNGYMDFTTSCLYVANLEVNQMYDLKVTTFFNTQIVKAWIDYNNDGDFADTDEEITPAVDGLTSFNGEEVIQSVLVPSNPTLNTYLRMRIISDIGNVSDYCHTSTYGQTEDYAVYITNTSGNSASVSISTDAIGNTICEGSTVTFMADALNGGVAPTYQWKLNGIDIVGATDSVYTTNSLSDADTISCVMTSNMPGVANNPAVSDVIVTVISTLPPTGNPTQSFCGSANVADLSANGSNIQWFANSSDSIPLSNSESITNGADYFASQTVSGCSSQSYLVVTAVINALPMVTMGQLPTICINDAPFTLTQGQPTGGTYSGSAVSGNSFDPSLVSAGNYTITYSYSDLNSCSGFATGSINVDDCAGLIEFQPTSYFIYPNPASDQVLIKSKNQPITLLRLFDNSGRLVLVLENLNDLDIHLELNPYAQGMYTIQLNSVDSVFNYRLVIKK